MNFEENEIITFQTSEADPFPKRAKRADAIANRALILATAQRLFAEKGIPNVCMASIAEAAQIGKGTLYRGFANKAELCLALMDEDMQAFQNKILQQLRATAEQPALARLDVFLDSLAHFMDFHAPLLREVQLQGILQNDPQLGGVSPHMWLPWLRDTIRVLLHQAEQNGESHNLDIPYLTDAILAPLNANLFIYQREVLGFDLERISQGARRLALRGCQGVAA